MVLQAQLTSVINERREIVARLEGKSLWALQHQADEKWPLGVVYIRDDRTSDGSYWGTGTGKLLAERSYGKWSVL